MLYMIYIPTILITICFTTELHPWGGGVVLWFYIKPWGRKVIIQSLFFTKVGMFCFCNNSAPLPTAADFQQFFPCNKHFRGLRYILHAVHAVYAPAETFTWDLRPQVLSLLTLGTWSFIITSLLIFFLSQKLSSSFLVALTYT